MTRPLTTLLLAAGIIVGTASSCAHQEPSRPTSDHRVPCQHPTRHELGFVQSNDGPWPSFRSAGEEMYVGVRGLEQDTVLGPVRLTRMSLVKVTQEPRFRPGSSVVLERHRHRRPPPTAVDEGSRAGWPLPGGLLQLRQPVARDLRGRQAQRRTRCAASLSTLRNSAVARGGRSAPPARLRRGRGPRAAARCRGRARRAGRGRARRGRR